MHLGRVSTGGDSAEHETAKKRAGENKTDGAVPLDLLEKFRAIPLTL